tara:strand:- start:5422 stop:5631 length:210 start_codon:yes stop_codon:yes gene_type:complete
MVSKKKHNKYISKGERPNVKAQTCKDVRRGRTLLDRELAVTEAYMKGKKIKVKEGMIPFYTSRFSMVTR